VVVRARKAAGAVVESGVVSAEGKDDARETLAAALELRSRLAELYHAIEGHVGPPTADQRQQLEYYPKVLTDIDARVKRMETP
jgi:hypothetical protein